MPRGWVEQSVLQERQGRGDWSIDGKRSLRYAKVLRVSAQASEAPEAELWDCVLLADTGAPVDMRDRGQEAPAEPVPPDDPRPARPLRPLLLAVVAPLGLGVEVDAIVTIETASPMGLGALPVELGADDGDDDYSIVGSGGRVIGSGGSGEGGCCTAALLLFGGMMAGS